MKASIKVKVLKESRAPWVILILIFLHAFCSAKGPAFPDAPALERFDLEGPYRFDLSSKFYNKNLANEVSFEKSKRKPKKNYFVMRTLGQNLNGSIRQRSYKGLAYRLGKNIVELRTERCYIHGKRDWENRITPLERWDCDHLFFAYKSSSNFRIRDTLEPVETERAKYIEWFSPTALIPMPTSKASSKRPVYFAGQIISLEESPKTKQVIVWGHSAGRLLRDGQILRAQDEKGKSVGKLKVLSRPGDFIVCRWTGAYRPQAKVAYALKAAYQTLPFL